MVESQRGNVKTKGKRSFNCEMLNDKLTGSLHLQLMRTLLNNHFGIGFWVFLGTQV